MNLRIRETEKTDIKGLTDILVSTELFPPEYLNEMISDYFENPNTDEIWFTSVLDGEIIGFGYCKPEKLTDGTYNLLAIAIKVKHQGKGIGKKMIEYIEILLQKLSKRILIIETSSQEEYKQTRDFYEKLNYRKEAVISDFWQDGIDKIIFWKKIQ